MRVGVVVVAPMYYWGDVDMSCRWNSKCGAASTRGSGTRSLGESGSVTHRDVQSAEGRSDVLPHAGNRVRRWQEHAHTTTTHHSGHTQNHATPTYGYTLTTQSTTWRQSSPRATTRHLITRPYPWPRNVRTISWPCPYLSHYTTHTRY
ncbi:hypothetical protein Pmani_031141 [Petrolisthes manimaculis]|uniref:Uncharacterized protein n=1 Tax=Petrolisthes manimaculis TaxID=1843537 RepID=A0AAE1TS98_9EUCA|nr:hypothetical protein Pmani_031141 [Petrolisthes manimaculis]